MEKMKGASFTFLTPKPKTSGPFRSLSYEEGIGGRLGLLT